MPNLFYNIIYSSKMLSSMSYSSRKKLFNKRNTITGLVPLSLSRYLNIKWDKKLVRKDANNNTGGNKVI
jgi:hypothetical protein